MKEDTSRAAWSIFCDDVRLEVNGKALFIGVYTSRMLVQQFPCSLRLVVVSHLRVPRADPVQLLNFKVYRDKDTIVEAKMIGEGVTTSLSFAEESPEDTAFYEDPKRQPPDDLPRLPSDVITATSVLQLQLDEPCMLRVRFETERGLIRAGGIIISQQNAPPAQTPS